MFAVGGATFYVVSVSASLDLPEITAFAIVIAQEGGLTFTVPCETPANRRMADRCSCSWIRDCTDVSHGTKCKKQIRAEYFFFLARGTLKLCRVIYNYNDTNFRKIDSSHLAPSKCSQKARTESRKKGGIK